MPAVSGDVDWVVFSASANRSNDEDMLIIDSAANLPAVEAWVTNPYLEIEFILKNTAGVLAFQAVPTSAPAPEALVAGMTYLDSGVLKVCTVSYSA